MYVTGNGGRMGRGDPSLFDRRSFAAELPNVLALHLEMEPAKPSYWRRSVKEKLLITVDELRAAGALDVPAAWRKSLSRNEERDLFSDSIDDDAPGAGEPPLSADEPA
jgi:hypothetical protein